MYTMRFRNFKYYNLQSSTEKIKSHYIGIKKSCNAQVVMNY